MSKKFSHLLSELHVNLGGHDVIISGGTVEFAEETAAPMDTLAGLLWVEDRRNVAVFPELAHKEAAEDGEFKVTYGVNAERILTPIEKKAEKAK